METNENGIVRYISDLFQRLHEANVLRLTGNETRADQFVDEFNTDLAGSHIRCVESGDSDEFVLIDTQLYERES